MHSRKKESERGLLSYLTGEKVEVGGVKLVGLGKVCHAHAKVSDFVNGGGSLLESLLLVDASVFD